MEVANTFVYDKYNLKTSEIEHEHLDKLNDIFYQKVVNIKHDKKDVTQITKVFSKKRQPQELEELFIRDLAIHYLANSGLEVNPHKFMIEFWRYRCFGDKLGAALPRHKDSYGIMLCPINTCIFYIRKDPTLRGGNLNIYDRAPIGRILIKPREIIESTCNKIVCMNGDIVHSITPFQGFGIRDAIVVQFEKAYKWKPLLPFINSIKTKTYQLAENNTNYR